MSRVLVGVVAGLVGLPVGSFLTVVVHRVPARASIVWPRSSCPACATPIRGVDNVPVFSYLLRRGHCRGCGSAIPLRYLLLESACALLFVAVALAVPSLWMVPAYCALAACLLALSAIDLAVFRLPTPVLYAGGVVGFPLLVFASWKTGHWAALSGGALCAALAGGFFGVVFLAAPGALGFGDVRLAVLCGAFLGWLGPRVALAGLFLSFFLGGAVGLSLLLTRRAKRTSRLAFGPFLSAGTITAVLIGPQLAAVWFR